MKNEHSPLRIFARLWRDEPLFGTILALLFMVIIQTLALGFNQASFGEWWNSFYVNWVNILRNNATVGIVALGMALVIISGGIDLAVGSTMAMTGALFLLLMDTSPSGLLQQVGLTGWGAFTVAFVLVVLFGGLLGLVNGVLVADAAIPSFIVTLGTMKIYRSVTQYFMQGRMPIFPTKCLDFASLKIGNTMLMPILYLLILAAVLYLLSKHTCFGNYLFAAGSNARTAKLAGINVDGVRRMVFVLMGVLVSLAAIIQICRIGSMDYSNAGAGYEMDSIAAVCVGGTRMNGGKGSIVGTLLGVLIISVMNNLLNLLGVPPFLREAFKGVIVIIAVLLQKKEN